MKHIDIVAAVDVVVLKTGYGIVSEVLIESAPCLYVPRPSFPEHEYLASALEKYTNALPISFEEVGTASPLLFEKALSVWERPAKAPFPSDGAEKVARFLVEYHPETSPSITHL